MINRIDRMRREEALATDFTGWPKRQHTDLGLASTELALKRAGVSEKRLSALRSGRAVRQGAAKP